MKKKKKRVNKAIGRNNKEEEVKKVKAIDVDKAHMQVYLDIFVH